MTELLIEFFSEEIPARMQLKAAHDLKVAFETKLKEIRLSHGVIKTFVTPRRLTAVINNLATTTEERQEERRGPRIGGPEAALQGFLRSSGVREKECTQKDGYWFAQIISPAQKTVDLLPDLIRTILREFSWAKSMRWAGADQLWVRPLRSVLTVFNGSPLVFELPEFGLTSSNIVYPHRVLGGEPKAISSFADYEETLKKGYVILDHHVRQKLIHDQLIKLGNEKEYQLVSDKNLLEEVAGLVEYPVVRLGTIDPQFMSLPEAVLSTSMRVHQKYFTFHDEKGNIAPVFGVVANTIPKDDALMMKGYQRVLLARLSDAAFFYEHDVNIPLGDLVNKLDSIIFHGKLGSLGLRVKRFQNLAGFARPDFTPAELDHLRQAALLCKSDLLTSMVIEFPELQGTMGEIYAIKQGIKPEVALALREHYQPQGPNDTCPSGKFSVELALTDKIDTLVGFFAIGEGPTGSKDPYGLRRAALGLIRLIRENNLKSYPLRQKISKAFDLYKEQRAQLIPSFDPEIVIQFIFDRLIQILRGEGIRHDAVTAVISSPNCGDDIWSIVERAASLSRYLTTESGLALQAAFRRAYGILAQQQISISTSHWEKINQSLFHDKSEGNLYTLLSKVSDQCEPLLNQHNYTGLMQILSDLRTPVDQFFDLKINHEDPAIRSNRLAMLSMLVQQTSLIADFSKLEG